MKQKHGKQRSKEEKLKIVQEYINSDVTMTALMAKYDIAGMGSISRWMRNFGFQAPTPQTLELNKQMAKETNKTLKERELEQKIRELEKALDYEKLRTRALETMIDIAENDLKIPIRKKSGTKQ
jgi:transposase